MGPAQEKLVAKMHGASRKELLDRRKAPCPPEAVGVARKALPLAIAAAHKATVLRKRGVLSDDAEYTVKRLLGHIGIFLGLGRFKSTFSSMTVYGDEKNILASKKLPTRSRKTTHRLVQELVDDLTSLERAGKEIEKIVPKQGSNYLLESPYLSIAAYVQGLAQTARHEIRPLPGF